MATGGHRDSSEEVIEESPEQDPPEDERKRKRESYGGDYDRQRKVMSLSSPDGQTTCPECKKPESLFKDITSEEEDWTQYTVDEELFDDDTAKMLQQLNLPTLDEQPGTSSKQQGKTIDTGTSDTTQHAALPPLLQRTPKIESTPWSMQFVKKLLVRKHGVKEEKAQAAVQSQGCDIEMCLQWIERNCLNFALLEEKSKQYEYSCGMISEPDMRKWAVEYLAEKYSIAPEVAKVAVQSKGLRAFGHCKRFALSVDGKSGDLLELAKEYDETLNDDQKTEVGINGGLSNELLDVARGMAAFDTFSKWVLQNHHDEKNLKVIKALLRSDGHTITYGIKEELLYELRNVARGMNGFNTFMNWASPNKYDEKKLKVIKKSRMELFGIKGELLNALLDAAEGMVGFDTFFEWVLRNQHDEKKLEAIINKRDLAYSILTDFMPEMVATAAVQAGRPGHIDLDECRKLAEENKDEEDTVQNISPFTDWFQRFETRHSIANSLMLDSRWQRFNRNFDLASKIAESSMIATSSTDKSECLKWIEKSRRKASEERKIVNLLISRMCNTLKPNFKGEFEDVVRHVTQMEDHQWLQDGSDDEVDTWRAKGGWRLLNGKDELHRWCEMFSVAAIKATSSTDLDTCRTWITRNAANKEKVLHLYQQYKNSRVGLEDCIFVCIRSDYDFIPIMDPSKRSTAGKMHTCQDDQESSKTCTPVGEMKTMATTATNTEKHEQETEDANLSCDSDGFLQISELKAEKVQKMGPVGGEIDLEDCSLIFPEGAVKEEKKFNVTLIHNPEKFPSFSIPITPILGCRPSMEFDKPVTVKMRTCYSAIGNAEITASLYQREDEGVEWVEVQKVTLTSNNQVQFDVMHFSDDMVGVSDDAGSLGEYHLINNVYIEKDTGRIASMFFVDQGAHDLATEDMRKRGIVTMMMKSKKIIAKMGTEINVAMECTRPDVTTRCFNPQVLKVTPNFLKKRSHEIYYLVDQIPGDFSGSILIQYTLKIQEEEDEILPLMISWPISLPEPQVLLNVENVSIDSRTSIRGDIVSTGESNTTVIQ